MDERTDAQICRDNNWRPGTHLAGNEGYGVTIINEGYGVTIIKITAIGEDGVLARPVSQDGLPIDASEAKWTLRYRVWEPIVSARTAGAPAATEEAPPGRTPAAPTNDEATP